MDNDAFSSDLDALAERWERQWPDDDEHLPGRYALRDRWVRFHSLPGSKRYADNDAEYAVLLGRHHTILDQLGPHETELYVVTRHWDGHPAPVDRPAELRRADPGARHWTSRVYDDYDPADVCYEHQYVSRLPRTRQALDPLLRLVADDVISGVTLAPADLRWLYHPYDGGGDVFAPSTEIRDALRAAHADWLSARADGM
ncbi:hypothetical protein AB0K51_04810 [Kitasatospora sp. NPDC049285]|uniref:DUF3885 domain-containing protein n=1 Tax=Kitasatospora sp. NPDC049285 TaxID=3157096 RepID=UPI0034173D37